MRTPIIVRRGSIELLTNHRLKLIATNPHVYKLVGWRGLGCVDAFEVATGRLTVKDDSDLGERQLDVWFEGTPSGAAPLQVRMSSSEKPRGVTIRTAEPLEGPSTAGGRQFLYTYAVDAAKFSYDLYTDRGITEGRDLDDAAFVLSLRHTDELRLTETFPKYLLLGAAAGVLGGLLARELGSRGRREP
jgi:hypothetical protein